MARTDGSSRKQANWTAIALLVLGSLLMLADVSWMAISWQHVVRTFLFDTFKAPVAIGLAALKLLPTIVFDCTAVPSMAKDLLVLCFALTGILVGLILLRRQMRETA